MLVDEARGQLHQLKSLDEDIRANNTAGRHVGRAISLMRQLLAEPKTVDELASMLAISRRQLDRLFNENLGPDGERVLGRDAPEARSLAG